VPPAGVPLNELAQALDDAMSRMAALDPAARQVAQDVVAALDAVHKAGLTTLVRGLKGDPDGKRLLFALVDEPEVRMLLAIHGIIRADPQTRARQVLDGVRPGLQSHGGDVELDGIRDGVAYVRLSGACNGCSMAAVTMREGVEAALVAGVPGLTGVEVLPNDPTPTLIPVSAIGIGPPAAAGAAGSFGAARAADGSDGLRAAGWCAAFDLGRVGVGELVPTTLHPDDGPALNVVVVNTAGQLAAYVNACAHQGLPLDNALVDAAEGTLTCPWHGFSYDATTGECMTLPGAQLRRLPLRVQDGTIWVRAEGADVGTGAGAG
jgi:nitrite reductase/ring-hydroxylating ferredoxin subunit/Fe-S cluster biogenesis protein NfuA